MVLVPPPPPSPHPSQHLPGNTVNELGLGHTICPIRFLTHSGLNNYTLTMLTGDHLGWGLSISAAGCFERGWRQQQYFTYMYLLTQILINSSITISSA